MLHCATTRPVAAGDQPSYSTLSDIVYKVRMPPPAVLPPGPLVPNLQAVYPSTPFALQAGVHTAVTVLRPHSRIHTPNLGSFDAHSFADNPPNILSHALPEQQTGCVKAEAQLLDAPFDLNAALKHEDSLGDESTPEEAHAPGTSRRCALQEQTAPQPRSNPVPLSLNLIAEPLRTPQQQPACDASYADELPWLPIDFGMLGGWTLDSDMILEPSPDGEDYSNNSSAGTGFGSGVGSSVDTVESSDAKPESSDEDQQDSSVATHRAWHLWDAGKEAVGCFQQSGMAVESLLAVIFSTLYSYSQWHQLAHSASVAAVEGAPLVAKYAAILGCAVVAVACIRPPS